MTAARWRLLLAVACGGLGAGPLATAQSLKCRNDFSQLGDTKAAIQLKCGEPIAKDSFCEPAQGTPILAHGKPVGTASVPCETVDEWTYNPGYGQFITTLRFESGVLKSVRYGDRVK